MINEYIGYGQELQGKITVSSKVRSNNLDGSIFEIPEFIFILTFRKTGALYFDERCYLSHCPWRKDQYGHGNDAAEWTPFSGCWEIIFYSYLIYKKKN